jgi:uncharacterized membrane protein
MTNLAFLSGAITLGFVVAALFFLRFWRDTHDELFLSFSIAFLLLGTAQAILALGGVPSEYRSWVYLVRLAAFVLILIAIARKNRPS